MMWRKLALISLVTGIMLTGCGLNQAPQATPEVKQASPTVSAETPVSSNDSPTSTNSTDSTEDFFKNYVSTFPDYTSDLKEKNVSETRLFVVSDFPENSAEALAVDHFYLAFKGEFDKLAKITGENEALQSSIKNEKKDFDEGLYIEKYMINDVSTLTQDDFSQTDPSFIEELKQDVSTYQLTQYTVAKVNLTWQYNDAMYAKGPQLDNGQYDRLFLIGKTATDDEWKIYELFWGEYVLAN